SGPGSRYSTVTAGPNCRCSVSISPKRLLAAFRIDWYPRDRLTQAYQAAEYVQEDDTRERPQREMDGIAGVRPDHRHLRRRGQASIRHRRAPRGPGGQAPRGERKEASAARTAAENRHLLAKYPGSPASGTVVARRPLPRRRRHRIDPDVASTRVNVCC